MLVAMITSHVARKLIGIGVLWMMGILTASARAEDSQAVVIARAQSDSSRPKVGLALSGGGARGFAHIGVLKVLKELNIPIDMIAGTSMGSVVGGLYALGYDIPKLEDVAIGVDWRDLFNEKPARKALFFPQKKTSSRYLFEVGMKGFVPDIPSGLSAGQKISNLFSLLTLPAAGVRDFDQLPIPFRAIATDIVDGSEVVLDGSQLSLAESIRASMAVPMVFTPVDHGEQLLVDGGLVKNLPVDIVKQMGADIVIAVDVSSPLRKKEELLSLFAIMDQTISLQITQSTEAQLKLVRDLGGIVLTPDLHEFSSADFAAAETLIKRGEDIARAQLAQLQTVAARVRHDLPQAAPGGVTQKVNPTQELITIEDVVITGNVSTRDVSLLHDAGIKSGQTLEAGKLAKRIENVFGGGFFESVKFGIEKGARGGHIVKVEVKERELNVIRVGARYDDKNQGVGLAGFSLHPAGLRNSLILADLEYGGVFGAQASFFQYRLFDTSFFFQPRVFYRDDFQHIYANQHKVAEFKNRTGGFELALGNTFRNLGEVTGRYQWRTVSFTPDRKKRGFPRFSGKIAAIGLGSNLETFDRFPFPRSGYALSLSANVANTAFGGDVDYARLFFSYSQYVSPLPQHTFGVSLRLGSSVGTRLPVSEELLFGGPDYFYGYAREELRGSHLGVARVEYRYKLFDLPTGIGEGTYLHFVFNTGNVWRTWRDVENRFRLRYGGGIGIGIDSVIGPIAVGYGRGDEAQDELYMSIGVLF